MQLIKHQKRQSCRSSNQLLFKGSRQQQLQHHIVCKDDVGRVVDDQLPFVLRLLTGIFRKPDWLSTFRISLVQEFSEFTKLTVAECIHRINDDRLHSTSGSGPQHMIDNGNDISQALPGPRACGQDVVLPLACFPKSIDLVFVQSQRHVDAFAEVLDTKDLRAFFLKKPFRDKLINPSAILKGGVQLN